MHLSVLSERSERNKKPPAMQVEDISLSFKKNKTSYDRIVLPDKLHILTKEVIIPMDKNSLSHTRWNCKYHIVFAPKYRRQIIYGKLKQDIGKILRDLLTRKGVKIIEAELCPDHIQMGYLKGKSSIIIFDRHANLKYKYGSRNFWCRGYYVDTAGKNAKKIEEYIRNQLKEDYIADQISLKEYTDPFTGKKNKR